MLFARRRIPLAVTLLLVSGCATSIQVPAPAEGCSTLIPDRWRQPVPSAVLGESGDAAQDWQLFGIAQTGKLNEANDRGAAVIETVQACERRDAQARRQAERAWYRRWVVPG